MNESEHRVHGVAADQVAPDWPPLTEPELTAVLARYPTLGAVETISWHSPRPLSAAALVRCDAGEIFVKRHHQDVRSPSTLREEHRFIAHLREHGGAVPRVLLDRDGDSAPHQAEWTYELHERAAGIDLYRDSVSWQPVLRLAHAEAAGRALGRLHRAAAGYQAPQRDTHILVTRDDLLCADDPLAALAAQLPQRPGLAVYLQRRDWQTELHASLAPWWRGLAGRLRDQPRLWTHNDWHLSNLFWSHAGDDAEVSAALDFGLASPTCAVFDLATAIERNAIAWLALEQGAGAAHIEAARALLRGYRQEAPLSAEQVRLLVAALPLVHLDFALSEVEYFQAITHSPGNADVAYEVFLRGHADWFATDPAQALLTALLADA